jgi:hypothetical protein
MRPTKIALSALALAFALGGPAYAMDSTAPAKPAASSTVHAAAPAKHHKKHSTTKKAPDQAKAAASTSTTHTGAH